MSQQPTGASSSLADLIRALHCFVDVVTNLRLALQTEYPPNYLRILRQLHKSYGKLEATANAEADGQIRETLGGHRLSHVSTIIRAAKQIVRSFPKKEPIPFGVAVTRMRSIKPTIDELTNYREQLDALATVWSNSNDAAAAPKMRPTQIQQRPGATKGNTENAGAATKANPRDKFCYEQRVKRIPLKTIMQKVNKRKGWEPLETVQGVSQAAKRHAQAQGLTWPSR
jgi:hypothetical protein